MTEHPGQTTPSATASGATVADQIMTALVPAQLVPSFAGRIDPLPLANLEVLTRDGSMSYDISRIDASGRVQARDLLATLGWHPGDRLDLTVIATTVVLRPSAGGQTIVTAQHGVVIPAKARTMIGVGNRDRLLLAAATRCQALIVHTLATLDAMIKRYYCDQRDSSIGSTR